VGGEVRTGSDGDADGGEDDGERADGTARVCGERGKAGHGGSLRREGNGGTAACASPCWLDPLRSCDREVAGGSRSFSAAPKGIFRLPDPFLPFSCHRARIWRRG